MIKRILERPGTCFALVFVWKLGLMLLTTQPVPSNDAFFYDGPVVNFLLHGKYANPALALALPISGNEVFCAYPPLYQLVLLGWMSLFGTSVRSAMFLHLVLFGICLLLLLAIFRRLKISALPAQIAAAFLLVLTFHDRPDSLAHVFGIAAVYAWVRSRRSLAAGYCSISFSVTVQVVGQASRRSEGRLAHGATIAGETPGAAGGTPAPLPEQLRPSLGQTDAGTIVESNSLAWSWAMVTFVVLGLATGLQIGGLYFLLIWIGMLATWVLAKEKMPLVPMAASVIVPIGLVALVRFGYPHLWAGFLEHARQTPSLTGWRVPRVAELLKMLRTVPGILAVAALLPWWIRKQVQAQAAGSGPLWLVTLACTLAALAIIVASMCVLTPNSVFFASYLQPLIVGCYLAMTPSLAAAQAGHPSSQRSEPWLVRWQAFAFVALAAVGAIRAIGMSTWGVACAADVGYSAAIDRVAGEIQHCPSRSTVVLSSAYLYEAARHNDIRSVHSDWMAPAQRGGSNTDVQAILSLKPAMLILTQFDFYRRFETILPELRSRPEMVDFKVVDTIKTPAPDAFKSVQKVVQHISWAPVIISFSWK